MRMLFLLALLSVTYSLSAQPPAIIPKPVSTEWRQGTFSIDQHTVLVAEAADAPSTSFFSAYLERIYGMRLLTVEPGKQPAANYIRLNTSPAAASAREGRYLLQVTKDAITITGDTHPG